MGWEKVTCCSTKAAISLKRVKIEEKLLWRLCRNSPTIFRTVPSPTPYGLLFPKIGGSQPPPKILITIISGTGKTTEFKFCKHITEQKPVKNFGKSSRGHTQGLLRDFSGHPYIGPIARSSLRQLSFLAFLVYSMYVYGTKSILRVLPISSRIWMQTGGDVH